MKLGTTPIPKRTKTRGTVDTTGVFKDQSLNFGFRGTKDEVVEIDSCGAHGLIGHVETLVEHL